MFVGAALVLAGCGGSDTAESDDGTDEIVVSDIETDPDQMMVSLGGWKSVGDATDFIDIENTGAVAISLEGWMLSNGGDDPYEFTAEAIVEPGQAARLHVRCGLDSLSTGEFFWCIEGEKAWDAGFGEVLLIDPTGAIIDDDSYQS